VRLDADVVAARLDHLLSALPGAREVMWSGPEISVEFLAELAKRGAAEATADEVNGLSAAIGVPDVRIVAALAAVLAVPIDYFFDELVAQRLDEDFDLLSGWLDYRNSGIYLCGGGRPDNRADLKAFVARFRGIQQHIDHRNM
jgi:hypothetical protein